MRLEDPLAMFCPLSENGAAFNAELFRLMEKEPVKGGCEVRRLPKFANWPLNEPRPPPVHRHQGHLRRGHRPRAARTQGQSHQGRPDLRPSDLCRSRR